MRYDDAKSHFLTAIKFGAGKENYLANYAQLLFIVGETQEGLSLIDKALALNQDRKNDLAIETWFYRYAHAHEQYAEKAIEMMEKLLHENIHSVGWDFSKNIEVAIANGHPEPDMLKNYAAAISAFK
jgi:tetratricopeptide (TPR) repeat protein